MAPAVAGGTPKLFNDFSNGLSEAAHNKDVEKVKKFLAEGQSLTSVDTLGQTALIFCVRNKAETPEEADKIAEITQLLVDAGSDVNTPDKYGDAPIHLCIMDGGGCPKTKAVDVLIKGGADVLKVTDNFKMTPLHWAAVCGLAEIAEKLVAAGARVNKIDRQRFTALSAAKHNLERLEKNVDYMGSVWDASKLGPTEPHKKRYREVIAYLEPLTKV